MIQWSFMKNNIKIFVAIILNNNFQYFSILKLFNWPEFMASLLFLYCNVREIVGKMIYLDIYMYTYINLSHLWPYHS